MKPELILILNSLAYFGITLYSYFNNKCRLGIYILLLFSISSLFAYLFYIQPLFADSQLFGKITIFPFVYLFTTLYLFISPILNISSRGRTYRLSLRKYDWRISTGSILVFLSIVYLALILLNLPDALRNIGGDIVSNRENVYGETGVSVHSNPLSKNALYINIDFFMQSISYYIIIICLNLILVSHQFKKKAFVLALFSFLYCLENGIILVSRGPILMLLLCALFMYLLYYDYVSSNIRKRIIIGGICLVPLGVFYAVMISSARFDSDIYEFFYYKYMGESMTNFNGLLFDKLKGTTNGEAYFTFFLRPFYDIPYLYGYKKWEFIESATGVSGQFFYTMIGGLLFEFGKNVTFLIALACYFLQKLKYQTLNGELTLTQCLIIVFFAKQLIFGVWLFNLQGPPGAYEIIGLILICFCLKKRYKCPVKTINVKRK